MVFRGLCLFLIFTQLSHAFATDRLRVIGRGIENRKTGEVIALACVGEMIAEIQLPSCKKVQAVKFTPGHSDFEIIPDRVFDLDAELGLNGKEPTSQDLKKYVRKINRDAKEFKNSVRAGKAETIVGWTGLAALGLFSGYMIYEDQRLKNLHPDDSGAGVKMGDFVLKAGALFVIISLAMLISQSVISPKSGVISEVMADQNGWNWSVRPKKLRNKAFYYIEAYLRDSCLHDNH